MSNNDQNLDSSNLKSFEDRKPSEKQDITRPDQNLNQDESQTIKIALAQSQFLVGDIKGNVEKIRNLALKAKENNADIVVFPELAILGYPPEDLLLRPTLPNRIRWAFEKLSDVKDIVMIIGYPHIDHNGTFNSAAIIHDGVQKGFYHKQFLPNYGVFDERRYFDKGRNHVLFDYKGVTIGLLICEDMWKPEPAKKLKQEGADIIITINSSPFEVDKQLIRKNVLSQRSVDNNLPIMYVNNVGGQDDLVFDGGSMVVESDGSIVHEAPRFLNTMLFTNYNLSTKNFDKQAKPPLALSQESEIYQALVVGLRDYVNNSGFNGVIIGLSGGIDSALTLCIAVDALGADKVYAVMLPYKYTSQISLEDAQAQARRLNVSYTVCPIFDAVDGIRHTLAPLFKDNGSTSTEDNIQARARGMVLMALSNKFGHLVITTGNKSELAVGHSTLYGDMAGGFDVLKDVYKSKIYELATYRNRLEKDPVIPERVIKRPPTTELRADKVDEDYLPDYQTLDSVLTMYVDADMSYQEIVDKGFEPELVSRIIHMVNKSEYKRHQSAIGTKISHKAFGRERRYPLVNGWSID